ncbi:uncharacterized protein G2W53_018708 [Senna tora]|uniref:Uncharacterized protein n=1 Tax=Senna tora TaxID=362788 RepID=A0A834TTL4_9FABA|nr:uncharacterized protein G2W53_018708 [Senna tora]
MARHETETGPSKNGIQNPND